MREYSGVGGFLHHTISRDNLLKALHLILEGMCVLPSLPNENDMAPGCESNSKLPSRGYDTGSERPPSDIGCLSDRELRVLKGLVEGASNKLIARRLGITDSTVKVHVKSIFRKTKMSSRIQLALWAVSRVGPLPSQQAAIVEAPEFCPNVRPRVLAIPSAPANGGQAGHLAGGGSTILDSR
jgi:DNA-binding NarL/FixJ family response regulator